MNLGFVVRRVRPYDTLYHPNLRYAKKKSRSELLNDNKIVVTNKFEN